MRASLVIPALAALSLSSSAFAADLYGSYPQYSSETTVREVAPPPPPVIVNRSVTTTTTTTTTYRHPIGPSVRESVYAEPIAPTRYVEEVRPAYGPLPIYNRPHRPWWAWRHHRPHGYGMY